MAVDAVFDSVSVGTTFKEKLAEKGVIFCSFSEAVQKHPDLVKKYLGSVVPYTGQLFRGAECGGVQRRLVLLHPERRALPDGAFDLFPHQRRGHRPVRAHADRGRRRRVRQLSGRLHRADARRESVARGGGGTGGAGNAQIKYSTVQNWYPGDKQGRGGIYNFVTKRGNCQGRELENFVDAGGDRLGDHLEVSELILQGDNSVGEFYSVALTNNYQQADTGTKMIHIGKNTRSTIISKGISAGHGQNTYRGLVKIQRAPRARATTRSAIRC